MAVPVRLSRYSGVLLKEAENKSRRDSVLIYDGGGIKDASTSDAYL
jgi:hypothetical protein